MNSFKISQFGESQNDPEPKRCADSNLATAAEAEKAKVRLIQA